MNYIERLESYIKCLKSLDFEIDNYSEMKFEALEDFSTKGSIGELKAWYYSFVKSSSMKIERIKLTDCEGWRFDEETGSIIHKSGEFFRVEGYRITGSNTREVTSGWDQPFLTQQGFDGGILGLIRKRFDGVPHYLIEAKEEPGNYNIVQISPTVQATYSNLKRAHKGNSTPYSQYFLFPENHPVKVIFNQWTSEDGGRLFNKRNRSMLIEYDEDKELPLASERFKWVSLYQLKYLIANDNAIIAPHIRGILSGV
ncbi:NDP-hexose 2,3-dehydratase family protein [Shewanella xiamenensis]|uniref:NDP-hexose 2,3-dehydratase family protein n=1 Tax=Shewanella xiamenensis TaxID=332186 RepID=UPI00313BB86C